MHPPKIIPAAKSAKLARLLATIMGGVASVCGRDFRGEVRVRAKGEGGGDWGVLCVNVIYACTCR